MAAQILEDRPGNRQHENAAGTGEVQRAAHLVARPQRRTGEEGKSRRMPSSETGKSTRNAPIDQQGETDPIEPGGEESGAEPPPEREGLPAAAAAIAEPNQAAKRNQQDRCHVHRWQRRRRQRTQHQRREITPPAGQCRERNRESLQRPDRPEAAL